MLETKSYLKIRALSIKMKLVALALFLAFAYGAEELDDSIEIRKYHIISEIL